MIVITGGAGFVGSNVVRALNTRGEREILVIERLESPDLSANLAGCKIAGCLAAETFRALLRRDDQSLRSIRAVLHFGACTTTTNSDVQYMLDNNFEYSKDL